MSKRVSTTSNDQTEQVVIGYLATGNSAYDLLCTYIDLLKETGKYDALVVEVRDYGVHPNYYINVHDQLRADQNTTLAG